MQANRGTVSIKITDRDIPLRTDSDPEAIVASVVIAAGEFTVGPNPADRRAGDVSFYWTGKRINNGILTIYDASGNVVNRIVVGADVLDRPSGNHERRQIGTWDLRDRRGRPVSEGTYLIRGILTMSDGTRERVLAVVGVTF